MKGNKYDMQSGKKKEKEDIEIKNKRNRDNSNQIQYEEKTRFIKKIRKSRT